MPQREVIVEKVVLLPARRAILRVLIYATCRSNSATSKCVARGGHDISFPYLQPFACCSRRRCTSGFRAAAGDRRLCRLRNICEASRGVGKAGGCRGLVVGHDAWSSQALSDYREHRPGGSEAGNPGFRQCPCAATRWQRIGRADGAATHRTSRQRRRDERAPHPLRFLHHPAPHARRQRSIFPTAVA